MRIMSVVAAVAVAAAHLGPAPLRLDQPVRGWTILSDSEPDAMAVIDAARSYGINHLQLSHQIVEDLRQIREPKRQGLVRRLIDAAHRARIQEVLLWDHALYDLEYYPAEFRTEPRGTIDLDNPAFWTWLKDDYRKLLDLVPDADGLVLTFIETGARAERQQSTKFPTNQDKLAAVVNAVADVVVGERKRTLYWKDVIDHLAPPWAKARQTAPQLDEVPWVTERGWLHADDRIDETYLADVIREKTFGVRLAEASLGSIEQARPLLRDEAYQELHHYFARTLLTARLHRAASGAYFGFRVYARGETFRTPAVMNMVREAMTELPAIAREIREYPVKPPVGQWNWAADADAAMRYHRAVPSR